VICINYGCGRRIQNGWVNVDAVVNPKAPRAPEVLHALTFNADGSIVEPTPLPDEYADVLMAAHVVEHFREWEAPFVVLEWKRLLKPGGKLILELPNIEAAARNLLAGMDPQMWQFPFYGDGSHKDPYMLHKFGYTPKMIRRLVQDAGFKNIELLPPQTHGPRPNRDMRVEAVKV
jgi:predicted SAM-dependent methyltransferase